VAPVGKRCKEFVIAIKDLGMSPYGVKGIAYLPELSIRNASLGEESAGETRTFCDQRRSVVDQEDSQVVALPLQRLLERLKSMLASRVLPWLGHRG
jgi:hypothetical protein